MFLVIYLNNHYSPFLLLVERMFQNSLCPAALLLYSFHILSFSLYLAKVQFLNCWHLFFRKPFGKVLFKYVFDALLHLFLYLLYLSLLLVLLSIVLVFLLFQILPLPTFCIKYPFLRLVGKYFLQKWKD